MLKEVEKKEIFERITRVEETAKAGFKATDKNFRDLKTQFEKVFVSLEAFRKIADDALDLAGNNASLIRGLREDFTDIESRVVKLENRETERKGAYSFVRLIREWVPWVVALLAILIANKDMLPI